MLRPPSVAVPQECIFGQLADVLVLKETVEAGSARTTGALDESHEKADHGRASTERNRGIFAFHAAGFRAELHERAKSWTRPFSCIRKLLKTAWSLQKGVRSAFWNELILTQYRGFLIPSSW